MGLLVDAIEKIEPDCSARTARRGPSCIIPSGISNPRIASRRHQSSARRTLGRGEDFWNSNPLSPLAIILVETLMDPYPLTHFYLAERAIQCGYRHV